MDIYKLNNIKSYKWEEIKIYNILSNILFKINFIIIINLNNKIFNYIINFLVIKSFAYAPNQKKLSDKYLNKI